MRQISHFGSLANNKENMRKKSRDIKTNLDLVFFILFLIKFLDYRKRANDKGCNIGCMIVVLPQKKINSEQ